MKNYEVVKENVTLHDRLGLEIMAQYVYFTYLVIGQVGYSKGMIQSTLQIA